MKSNPITTFLYICNSLIGYVQQTTFISTLIRNSIKLEWSILIHDLCGSIQYVAKLRH